MRSRAFEELGMRDNRARAIAFGVENLSGPAFGPVLPIEVRSVLEAATIEHAEDILRGLGDKPVTARNIAALLPDAYAPSDLWPCSAEFSVVMFNARTFWKEDERGEAFEKARFIHLGHAKAFAEVLQALENTAAPDYRSRFPRFYMVRRMVAADKGATFRGCGGTYVYHTADSHPEFDKIGVRNIALQQAITPMLAEPAEFFAGRPPNDADCAVHGIPEALSRVFAGRIGLGFLLANNGVRHALGFLHDAAYLGPMQDIAWPYEFRSDYPLYSIPDALFSAVHRLDLENMSYHNDACPSWGRYFEGAEDSIRIWVEHDDPAEREIAGARYMVSDGDSSAALLSTDSISAALECLEAALRRAEQEGRK
jgi:hypothetical protein